MTTYDLPTSPAAQRNKDAILEALRPALPASGLVLEVASGYGEHAVHFARAMPNLDWQPSDTDSEALQVITSRVYLAALPNLHLPIEVDATSQWWPITRCNVVFSANMIHISPWEATLGLFKGSARLLGKGSLLATYGPYSVDGKHTAPSNEAFDSELRIRDRRWGVRDTRDLQNVAKEMAFRLEEMVPMPANNLTLLWRKD